MECGFCLKTGERISSPSAVLAQKGLGTLGMTEVMLVCRRKGTGKNALTLTCEQEPAVSQQGGFGMDSPQKQPQQQQKLQSFMEVWFWDGFTLKTILSQKPWFCFWQFAVQNYFNNKLDFNCLINFTLLTSPTAGSHWEICDPCRILGQRKSCFIVFWRIIPGKPIAWHSILI